MECPACQRSVPEDVRYCPHCGFCLSLDEQARLLGESEGPTGKGRIGRYTVTRPIGKGGMGEVSLVWDPEAHRYVALKKIQPSLAKRDVLYRRFLREAWITSRLSHPGVVAIYSIHAEGEQLYYTMPYLKGRNLKAILREAREAEKDPGHVSDANYSIPSLVRVFVSLAQVMAYVHSRGVLHRDLKPENVMVGDFGEVYLLDWGLAKVEDGQEEEESLPDEPSASQLTLPGKIFGTLSYMAPERAKGKPANEATETYALGVILYQILCLRLPFKRPSIQEFRRNVSREVYVDPAKRAPYRNVPHMLARIARRCLSPKISERYQSVSELLRDLNNYLEGRSEWFHLTSLDLDKKSDWEFQENVYLARDTALTGTAEVTEWVTLMVSRRSYPGNIRLTTRVRLGESGSGVGILLSIPEAAEREIPDIGYCLWLSGDPRTGSKLIRSSVDVLDAPDVYLKPGHEYDIRLEKIENSLHFYLDGERKFSYISYLPLGGTHIGLMYRDADFQLSELHIDVGSYSIKVNCLAVPDAFLANKDYERALAEYRRIGYSFAQRDEGREAKFRAGITLLEQARETGGEAAFDAALDEFETLHETAGAPLEYLGKSLVYVALGDNEEEVKCFQLAFRRYRHHPLLPALQEQVVYRIHEASRKDRWAAYRFVLLCAQLLPGTWERGSTKRLVDRLQRHWEPLPFMLPLTSEEKSLQRQAIAIQLSFWLGQSLTLCELATAVAAKPIGRTCLSNALFALVELGSLRLATPLIQENQMEELYPLLTLHTEGLDAAIAQNPKEPRVIAALMEAALRQDKLALVHQLHAMLPERRLLSPQQKTHLRALTVWADLLAGDYEAAREKFDHFPLEWINMETSLLHPLYGCLLAATEGEAIALVHLGGVLETPFPRSWALLGHYLTDPSKRTQTWLDRAFLWEKRQLYRQLTLYYTCTHDQDRANQYRELEKEQYIHD